MDSPTQCRRLLRPCTAGAGIAVGLLIAAHALGQGARPIEFSEARGASSTNAPTPGAERSRLDSLEEQISKSLDIFEPDDSLRGSAVPFPRAPVRPPAAPREPRRPEGLFEDDEAWAKADPMAGQTTLQDLLDVESLFKDQEQSRRESRPAAREDSADWMDVGRLNESFWELPLSTGTRYNESRSQPGDELGLTPAKSPGDLDRLFAAQSRDEPWGITPREPLQNWRQDRSASTKSTSPIRREPYGTLPGFGQNPAATADAATPRNEAGRSEWDFGRTQTSPWSVEEHRRALTPVRIPETRSWLPQVPTAPQSPGTRNWYEADVSEPQTVEPPTRTSGPFRDPVRRGF